MSGENYTEKVSVNINSSTLSQIDLLVDNGYYSNRSDFINQALREGLHGHRNTLDRIIDAQMQKNEPADKTAAAHRWFAGVYHFDARELKAIQKAGARGSITGYGVLAMDKALDEKELFETVETIRIKGKVIASESIKRYYGLK